MTRKLSASQAFRFLSAEFTKRPKKIALDGYTRYRIFTFLTDKDYKNDFRMPEREGICSGIAALKKKGIITSECASKMMKMLNRTFKQRNGPVFYWAIDFDTFTADPTRAAVCYYLARR